MPKGMGYPGTKKNKNYGSSKKKSGGPKVYGGIKGMKKTKKIGAVG